MGQVGTTDGSLEQMGLVVLEDDKNWQNAENLCRWSTPPG